MRWGVNLSLQDLEAFNEVEPEKEEEEGPGGPAGLTPRDVAGRLRSLEEIFSSLHVESAGCRARLVCHLAKANLTHSCCVDFD